MKPILTFATTLLLASIPLAAAEYDVIIRDGRVVDGTGKPAQIADVAIRDGRIVAVAPAIVGRGREEVDATGLHVAPGFIDVHTHAENIVRRQTATNFLRMGTTTLIMGNCGASQVDVAGFFTMLEAQGLMPNVATLIGHNSVRKSVIGTDEDRDLTPMEIERMRRLVDKAMRDGALGLSSGRIYAFGGHYKTTELIELAREAARHGGIYASPLRDEEEHLFEALGDLLTIGAEAKIPLHISHIKLTGKNMWGRANEVLARIEQHRAAGLTITQDQYLYTAGSAGLCRLIPECAHEIGRDAFAQRVASPFHRQRMKNRMLSMLRSSGYEDYSHVAIAYYNHDRTLNGLRIPEAARQKLESDSLDAQMELLIKMESHGGGMLIFHNMTEVDVRTFIRHPATMIASHSEVRSREVGVPHPRGYGNAARAIGRYARDLEVLTLEEVVRRMTSLPASTFKLAERGQITPGYAADIVVFDAASVRDNATFEEPHQYATGFVRVLVNGVTVVKDDQVTDARPGRFLRRATP